MYPQKLTWNSKLVVIEVFPLLWRNVQVPSYFSGVVQWRLAQPLSLLVRKHGSHQYLYSSGPQLQVTILSECAAVYLWLHMHRIPLKDAPVAHNVWAKYYRHFHFHSFQCFQESFPKWFEDTLCAHIVRATQVMSKLKIQINSEMWKKTKISSTCMPNFSLIPSKLQHRNTQLLTFHSKTLCTDQPYALRRASKFVPLC